MYMMDEFDTLNYIEIGYEQKNTSQLNTIPLEEEEKKGSETMSKMIEDNSISENFQITNPVNIIELASNSNGSKT